MYALCHLEMMTLTIHPISLSLERTSSILIVFQSLHLLSIRILGSSQRTTGDVYPSQSFKPIHSYITFLLNPPSHLPLCLPRICQPTFSTIALPKSPPTPALTEPALNFSLLRQRFCRSRVPWDMHPFLLLLHAPFETIYMLNWPHFFRKSRKECR